MGKESTTMFGCAGEFGPNDNDNDNDNDHDDDDDAVQQVCTLVCSWYEAPQDKSFKAGCICCTARKNWVYQEARTVPYADCYY